MKAKGEGTLVQRYMLCTLFENSTDYIIIDNSSELLLQYVSKCNPCALMTTPNDPRGAMMRHDEQIYVPDSTKAS